MKKRLFALCLILNLIALNLMFTRQVFAFNGAASFSAPGGTLDQEAEFTAVDIPALFESAEAVLLPVCTKRGNTLAFSSTSRCRIHGNPELLLQVLINLVVNANRHTEKGMISVEAEDDGPAVALRVRDNGKGIAPEVLPHIFEKGFTTTEGRGLGLSICSETVALHGGTLEVESTGPEGSCFRFTIPKEDET